MTTDCVDGANRHRALSESTMLQEMAKVSAKRRYEETWRFDEDDPGPSHDIGPWEDLDPEDQAVWLGDALLDLAAAFSICEVQDEWRHGDQWHSHQCPDVDGQRLVIRTPAMVVP